MELRHYDKLLQHFHSSDLCSPASLIAFTITENLNEAAGQANEQHTLQFNKEQIYPIFFQNKIEFFSCVYILGKKSFTHTHDISLKNWIGRYFTPMLKYSINTNMLGTKKVCFQ